MRVVRGLLIGVIGLGACLPAGCLRSTLPPDSPPIRAEIAAHAAPDVPQRQTQTAPSSDYLMSPPPPVPPDVQPASVTMKTVNRPAEKPVEPVLPRPQAETSASPAPPLEPPRARMEVQPAPLTRPDPPSVQVLRSLLESHSEGEINEQLKSYEPATREVMLLLLTHIAQLEQKGSLTRISPRELAVWLERLNTLTASLRGRAQLILERMCFCSAIRHFGDFTLLPTEHKFFRPGEVAHIYVQGRNFSSRRNGDKFVTVLKGRLEIYDDSNRARPPISCIRECADVSASPRQDYFINFRFEVPSNCPAGLYTVRIAVEDWTDAPPGAKNVPESRIAQRTLDFRVGGPVARRPR